MRPLDSYGQTKFIIHGTIIFWKLFYYNQNYYCSQAEQRLAARRAARAEAREIRMRELERQQREQEDHADKAYDMYAGKLPGEWSVYLLEMLEIRMPEKLEQTNRQIGD